MSVEAGHAPTYYCWSRDRPCTTNATYGYTLKGTFASTETTVTDLRGSKSNKSKKNKTTGTETAGPGDYVINSSLSESNPASSDLIGSSFVRQAKKCPTCLYPPSSINKFNINRGYVMGYVPISAKLRRGSGPVGCNVRRIASAPPAYEYKEGRGKDICLWHSLSGTLVHCTNYGPEPQEF